MKISAEVECAADSILNAPAESLCAANEQAAGGQAAPAQISRVAVPGSVWWYTFKASLPVLFSYLPVGFAFGMAFVDRTGAAWYWPVLCSSLMVAVASEFVLLGMMIAGAGWLNIAMVMPLVNARFMFLGLTLIGRYQTVPFWTRVYLIFALTPGAYSLVTTVPVPAGMPPHVFYRRLTVLCHSYTIASTLIGATMATVLNIDTEGFEFALTALFTVFLIEQWFIVRVWTLFVIAFGCSVVLLALLPGDHFLLTAMTLTLLLILGVKPWLKPTM